MKGNESLEEETNNIIKIGIMKLDEYGKKYPDLLWDIWSFFADRSIKCSMIKDWEHRCFNPEHANDYSHVKENLKKSLKTLNNVAKLSDVERLIFVTNSPNPFIYRLLPCQKYINYPEHTCPLYIAASRIHRTRLISHLAV